jgi:NADH-quinone oxidoreductase subunit H
MTPIAATWMLSFVVATAVLTATALGLWFERKLAARMQSRLGPTMVGPVGLLQPVADLLKMLQKEPIVPEGADRLLFWLAPPLTAIFALLSAALVPWANGGTPARANDGVLLVLALGGLAIIPVWVAGWASRNKYALLGAMRAVAQSVSYGVPLVLSALVPVILAGSMDLNTIVQFQGAHGWFALWPTLPGLPAFLLFVLALLAESNRIPFDIPEAESELVAGVTTEYTGMQFGLVYMAEYIHTLVGSAVASVLFLGGWEGPGVPGVHWMILKTGLLFAALYWLRWSLIRLRADQLMSLCWKRLVPGGLALVFLASAWTQLHGGS